MLRLGFIGGGKMAQAMASGFISAGLTKGENITASVHPNDKLCYNNFKKLGANATFENKSVVSNSDIIFISTKPSVVPVALSEVKNIKYDTGKLFLSIAMGVTIEQLEKLVPDQSRVMRVMPNTPALVRQAASCYVMGSRATPEDVETTRKLLEAVGTCYEVTESMIDAVTALSGSGPAYVYILIESLSDGGVKMGLPRDLSYKLAAQTVLGAGKMVLDTSFHPGVLKDDVTSPAGSTTEGLHFLEKKGFRAAVIGAVEAATQRCREVSKTEVYKKWEV